MAFDDNQREFSLGELENANTDRTTNPAVMLRGMMVKSGGAWYAAGDDAGKFRVSALGVSVTTTPLSADSSKVSAVQGDAGILHTSAYLVDDASISKFLGRVSSIGGTSTPLSADSSKVSAVQGDAGLLRISSIQGDAGVQRTSAFVDSGSVSAKSADANQLHVSSVQGDAGLQRTSAIAGDAGLLRVSSIGADAGNDRTSAFSNDAGLFLVSAKSGTATQLVASAAQSDAGVLRVSADMFADTVGSLTVFQTLSVSASQSVKGSAGSLYGWYLYNTDTKPNYVKFYNVSAAANIGTDTPLLTIMLPASAAANVEYAHGMKGFTAGINITATSGRPLDNTAAPAASSVGAVLFYV